MPNIIPPIVSSSPPPLDPVEDDNDEDDNEDEFGDFTVADFGSHAVSGIQKSVPDTSWTLPDLNTPPLKPEIFENGVISLELSTEDPAPESRSIVRDEDELFGSPDNASHDSVVSAVTDSGNCSASQNSNGTSPMPCTEVEDEAVVKPDDSHLQQNGSTCPTTNISADSGELNGSADAKKQNSSDFNKASDMGGNRTLNTSSETFVDDSFVPSDNTLTSSPAKNYSDEFSITKYGNGQGESSKTEVFNANSTSFPLNRDDGDPDDFGVWNSSTLPLEFDGFQSTDTQSKLCSESRSDATLLACYETEVSKVLSLEDNDCVRGMIIPDIPGLSDFDGDDEEFGELRGNDSPVKCSSGPQSIDEPGNDDQYLSPSRRPTLVLSDTVTEMTDTQLESTVEDIQDASQELADASSNVPNNNSVEGSNSVSCNAGKEENCVSSSSKSSTFGGDFADEFADFSHAQVEETSASDVWAQTAKASSIQTVLPSHEPLEFDDFDDYESAEFQPADPRPNQEPSANSYFDLNKIQSTLHEVLKENFPVPGGSNTLTEMENMGSNGVSGLVLDVEESPTWQGLRDLEATSSLSFVWAGSHSNRGLLGALNIDSRNILFGPKWNTVVPRFAANLGFSPLEPVRAIQNQPPSEPPPRPEVIQPQVVESIKPSSSEQGFQEVVPAAQFDWNDSGLTNPLDSNKDQMNGALATTAASGNPAMTTTPLQVEQLLASSKRSAPTNSLEKKSRDPTLSPEAVRVLDTLPELAFLSARMLMFPVQGDRNENKL